MQKGENYLHWNVLQSVSDYCRSIKMEHIFFREIFCILLAQQLLNCLYIDRVNKILNGQI